VAGRSNPMLRRRRLGNELRRLREVAGLKSEEVAKALYVSQSTISRIETGRVRTSLRNVRDLLNLYGVGEQQREALLQLARSARETDWWHAWSDVPSSIATFLSLEAAADQIRIYEALLVPGLMQTAAYARTVIGALYPDLRPDEVDHWTQLRKARHDLLRQEDPPAIFMILDEAVLRRSVGGREVMRQQLQRLIEDSALENVTLQVLPFEDEGQIPMHGSFTILGFQDLAQPDVVHLEHQAGDLYLDSDKEVLRHRRSFEHLQESALDPDASADLLAELSRKR
jgi:transcriptional regulator with XRE-family HTH domain